MIFKINKSLASRIVFYVLTFCIFLFLVSLSLFYVFSKKSITDMTLKNAESLTQNTVFKTEQVLLATEKISNNYKWMLETKQFNCDSLQILTQKIVKNNPEILGCAIAFEPNYFPDKGRYYSPYSYKNNDSIITTILGSSDYEYFVMDWYQIPTTIGKPYWTEPYFDAGGASTLMTTYSVPFYKYKRDKKELVGTITIDLSLNWLTDIVSSVHLLETGYATVITQTGTFVTHPNKELIMHQSIFSYAKELNCPHLRGSGRPSTTMACDCSWR